MRRSSINIELDFKTKKGKSIIKQSIKNSYRLNDILSEGEQKTIALAEFLTEIQMDQNKAPVIFDDPVTSLDHKIIDNISDRLLKLSENRQVIIFTHSILMFNSLIEKSKNWRFNKEEAKYYEVQKDTKFSGYLYETKNPRNDTYKKYKSEINDLLNSPKEKRIKKESEIACSCYSKLRSAIEVFLEKEALAEIVERYKKNVSVTKIERLNGELIDNNKEDIIRVFENCCKYIDAHSSATPLLHSASLEEFKIDFDKMNKIRKKFVS